MIEWLFLNKFDNSKQDISLLKNRINQDKFDISKGFKKKMHKLDTTRPNTEKSPKNTDRYDTEFDEKKLQILIKSLEDMSELHPGSTKLFVMIKEGLEDSLQRLISRK